MFLEIIGPITAIFTIIMYIPQTLKVIKAKTAEGISKVTYIAILFACLAFTIYAPMTPPEAMWWTLIPNAAIAIMMLPLTYFMFKDKIYYFIGLVLSVAGVIAAGVAMNILGTMNTDLAERNIEETMKVASITVALASGGVLMLAFLPQLLGVMKTKKVGNVSIVSIILLQIGNSFWVMFWIGNYMEQAAIANIFQMIFVLMMMSFQIPVLFYDYKEKKQASKLKSM